MSAPAFAPGTLLMAGLLTALTSSQGLLTTASKTGGAYAYNFAAVPFLAELTKLAISYLLLERQRRADPASVRITRDWRTLALFIVPSIIYMVHNNVQVGLGATGVVHAFPCLLIAMRVGGRAVGRVLAAACCEIDAPAGAAATGYPPDNYVLLLPCSAASGLGLSWPGLLPAGPGDGPPSPDMWWPAPPAASGRALQPTRRHGRGRCD